MIVTVSIRREDNESSRSVSHSIPTLPLTETPTKTSAIRNAILDAGVAAIVEATKEGWLDSNG